MEQTNRYSAAKTTSGGSLVSRVAIGLFALITTLLGVAMVASLPL